MSITEPGRRDAERPEHGRADRVFGADQAMVARRTALNRPEGVLGVEIIGSEPGRIEARMPAPFGRPYALGWMAFLIDALGGRPIHTLLPASSAPRTVDLRIDVTPEQARPGELLRAIGEVDALDEWSGLSHVRVRGADGRLLGLGTGRFAVVLEEEFDADPAQIVARSGAYEGSPTDLLDARPYGTGVVVPLRPGLANQYGALHGGLHAVAAEVALDLAAAIGGSSPGRLQTLTVGYPRPALTTNREVVVYAEVTRTGRRVVTAAGSMVGAGDRTLATFEGTYLRGFRQEVRHR